MDSQHSSGAFLYTVAIGIVTGIALALIFSIGIIFPLVCMGAACVVIVLGVVMHYWLGHTHYKKVFLIAIACAALALGAVRTDMFLSDQAAHTIAPYVSKSATVVGVVTNDPERRATSLHANIEVQSIDGVALSADKQGTLLAILGRDEPVAYGDTVEVQGEIALPQAFETSTGHLFDYPDYLQVQGISAIMPRATVMYDTHGGFSIQGFLFSLKHMFEQSVERLFPEPDASLLEGILLGERRGIPQNLTDAFIASGLVHVVVLSGHNITIVSEGVFRALSFLPRAASYPIGAVGMVFFALMTGAGATTVRALVMALVALVARYLHRQALAMRSLAAAGAAMALWNPNELLHDPSFILSMLATFGLITISPMIEHQWLTFLWKHREVRSVAASTIAVEIFVTPALLYFSGVLSFLSLPANILALPVIPLAMLSGFIAGMVGISNPALGFVPAVICGLVLKWMLFIVNTVQALPHSTATVAQFPAWIMLAVYIPLTGLAVYFYRAAVEK